MYCMGTVIVLYYSIAGNLLYLTSGSVNQLVNSQTLADLVLLMDDTAYDNKTEHAHYYSYEILLL